MKNWKTGSLVRAWEIDTKIMREHGIKLLLLLALPFIVYSNSLDNGFVWDDHLYIEHNPFVQDPGNLKRILHPSFYKEVQEVSGGARPLFIASLIVDQALWNGEPGGYHLSNLFLHVMNVLLVYFLCLFIFPLKRIAFIAALLFAVHPVQTEAVNSPSFRTDLLAGLFMFAGLLAFLRARQAGTWGKALLSAASVVFYGLGLLSKEMAITLPVLVLLAEFYCPANHAAAPRASLRGRRVWLASLVGAYALVAVLYLGFRAPRSGYHAISTASQSGPTAAQRLERTDLRSTKNFTPSLPSWKGIYQDPWSRAWTMTGVFAEYFRLLAVPVRLQADRAPRVLTTWRSWNVLLALSVLVLLGCLAFRLRTSDPPTAFGLAWCFVALAPVSGIIPIYNPMAERYLYIVSVGACWVLASLISRLGSRIGREGMPQAVWQGALAALVLVPYGWLTYSRTGDWKNDAALFGTSRDVLVNGARVHYNRGYLKQQQGLLTEALAEYRRALAINPEYVEALVNIAGLLEGQGKTNEALAHYYRAVALKPKSAIPYFSLARLQQEQGNLTAALASYEKTLEIDYEYAPAHQNLAAILSGQNRMREAAEHLKTAARLEPDAKLAYANLGKLYESMGRFRDAKKTLLKVIALDSRDLDANLNLGVVSHRLGDLEGALFWIGNAKMLDPKSPAVHFNLGMVQESRGRLTESREALKEAIRLAPDYSDALYSLGVIQQKLGRNTEAVSAYEAALLHSPHKLELLNNLGALYELEGRLQESEELLVRALAVDPYRPGLHNNLGNISLKQGKVRDAAQSYRRALMYAARYAEPASNTAPTLTNLGICYLQLGRVDDAIAAWEESVRVNPGYRDAYKHLASIKRAEALARTESGGVKASR